MTTSDYIALLCVILPFISKHWSKYFMKFKFLQGLLGIIGTTGTAVFVSWALCEIVSNFNILCTMF